jgi:hypothetical protein
MKVVRKAPYSYTSKEPEASQAAYGNDIYVFEVRLEPKNVRSYWLGYKYKAYEKHLRAGGALWPGDFKFKNAGRPATLAEGAYFDSPVEITDPEVKVWLRDKQLMAELPAHFVGSLEALLGNPAHGAKTFD